MYSRSESVRALLKVFKSEFNISFKEKDRRKIKRCFVLLKRFRNQSIKRMAKIGPPPTGLLAVSSLETKIYLNSIP